MKAVVFDGFGDVAVMQWTEVAKPQPGPGQLLVRVAAAGVNRADVLQRKGFYPPPAGESEIPGLEIAGEVAAFGADVTGFTKGDRVFGLVAGGGYSEYCLLHQDLAMPMPPNWDFVKAAAIPEVFFTANETLLEAGRLQKGESVLIHAGGSGVGSTAIQMAREVGARIFTTVGDKLKADRCKSLGAQVAINYKTQDFVTVVKEQGGVSVVLDFIGAAYLNGNLKVLQRNGRLVVVGLLGGAKAELNLGLVLAKRLQIIGSVMRSAPLAEKAAITTRFRKRWLPLLEQGKLDAIIYKTLPIQEVRQAHGMMERSEHFGKIVLTF